MTTPVPSDVVKAYHSSLAKLETARRELKVITSAVVDVALKLMEWMRRPDDATTPRIAVAWHKRYLAIDKEAWPDADRLATTVDTFHAARAETLAAYDAIPEEQRKGLVSPPR